MHLGINRYISQYLRSWGKNSPHGCYNILHLEVSLHNSSDENIFILYISRLLISDQINRDYPLIQAIVLIPV